MSTLRPGTGPIDQLVLSAEFATQKLTFIESRIDAAQSTVRDVLRHVHQHLTEYDPEKGKLTCLKQWLARERDQWLVRRL